MTQDAYQDAVTKLMNYLNDTVVFAKAQLPDVANQMLVYGAEITHFWMMLWIIAAAFSFTCAVICWVIAAGTSDAEGAGCGMFLFLLTVAFSVFAGVEYTTIIEIRDAPKLYIMDELANKLKLTK